MIASDLSIVLPEIILSLYAMGALIAAVYTKKDAVAPLLVWSTAALFVVLGVWIGLSGEGDRTAFGGMFNDDGFARFAKVVILYGLIGFSSLVQMNVVIFYSVYYSIGCIGYFQIISKVCSPMRIILQFTSMTIVV